MHVYDAKTILFAEVGEAMRHGHPRHSVCNNVHIADSNYPVVRQDMALVALAFTSECCLPAQYKATPSVSSSGYGFGALSRIVSANSKPTCGQSKRRVHIVLGLLGDRSRYCAASR